MKRSRPEGVLEHTRGPTPLNGSEGSKLLLCKDTVQSKDHRLLLFMFKICLSLDTLELILYFHCKKSVNSTGTHPLTVSRAIRRGQLVSNAALSLFFRFVFPRGSPSHCLQLSSTEECLPTEAFVWLSFLPTRSYELCQQCADCVLSGSW